MMAAMLSNRIPLSVSLPQWLAEAVNFVSLSFHFESFSRGLLDSRDLSFFILATALFLFLNTRVLIGRKWN
jgi:ABC-2 type transport system permease protein